MAITSGKKPNWPLLYGSALILDIVQWILIPILGVGDLVDEISDPIIGGGFAWYLQKHGVDLFKDTESLKRLGSLVGSVVAEMVTISILPAWIFDMWYIHRNYRAEMAVNEDEEEQQELLANNIRQPLYANGVGRVRSEEPNNVIQLNQNGIRPPNQATEDGSDEGEEEMRMAA